MALTIIGSTVSVDTASATTVFTMPQGSSGFISNLTVYNGGSTGNITISVLRQDGTAYTLDVVSVANGAQQSWSGGSTRRLTPITLNEGEILKAQAANAGAVLNFSGLRR